MEFCRFKYSFRRLKHKTLNAKKVYAEKITHYELI